MEITNVKKKYCNNYINHQLNLVYDEDIIITNKEEYYANAIIDIFDCIKDSEKYMFGTESMIANGGIKYLCMSIYIFYSIMQFVIGLIACILLFKKKYMYFISFICIFLLINLIFSKYGLIIFIHS